MATMKHHSKGNLQKDNGAKILDSASPSKASASNGLTKRSGSTGTIHSLHLAALKRWGSTGNMSSSNTEHGVPKSCMTDLSEAYISGMVPPSNRRKESTIQRRRCSVGSPSNHRNESTIQRRRCSVGSIPHHTISMISEAFSSEELEGKESLDKIEQKVKQQHKHECRMKKILSLSPRHRRASTGSLTLSGQGEDSTSSQNSTCQTLKSCLRKDRYSLNDGHFFNQDEDIGLPLDDSNRGLNSASYINSSTSSLPKNVKFKNVMVRRYSSSISHNPSVKDGYAVGLGWNYEMEEKMEIDYFEKTRPPPVESSSDLKMGSVERLKILKASGHDMKEIQKARGIVRKGNSQRMRTLQKLSAEGSKKPSS